MTSCSISCTLLTARSGSCGRRCSRWTSTAARRRSSLRRTTAAPHARGLGVRRRHPGQPGHLGRDHRPGYAGDRRGHERPDAPRVRSRRRCCSRSGSITASSTQMPTRRFPGASRHAEARQFCDLRHARRLTAPGARCRARPRFRDPICFSRDLPGQFAVRGRKPR